MTSFGIVFLSICLIGLVRPIKFLFGVLLFSCVFQGAAVFNFGGFGFPPYIFAEIFFICKIIMKHYPLCELHKKALPVLAIFVIYCLLITFFAPFMFEGTPVITFETHDQDLINGVIVGRLSFSIKNLAQTVFLLTNTATIYSIIKSGKTIPPSFIISTFKKISIIVIIIGFWEWAVKMSGFLQLFPDWFFYNNEGYAQYWLQGSRNRLNSTFIEPSYAGGYLSATLISTLYRREKNKILIFCLGLALLLNLSGTGLMTFIIVMGLYLIKTGKNRIRILVAVSIVYILTIIISYDVMIANMLMNKSTSVSGMARMGAITYSLSLIQSTYFMGVGLGSHRCFSFLTNLMAAVGIIGFVLFFYYIKLLSTPILKYTDRQCKSVIVFGLTLFVAQCLALPDFSFPLMWMWIFMAAAITNWIIYKNSMKR